MNEYHQERLRPGGRVGVSARPLFALTVTDQDQVGGIWLERVERLKSWVGYWWFWVFCMKAFAVSFLVPAPHSRKTCLSGHAGLNALRTCLHKYNKLYIIYTIL